MGTKVQSKSYLTGYRSMRDLDENSNIFNWPFRCGDKTIPNGQYCNGFSPKIIADAYPKYDKDLVKRTMLEHEAIFKNQVYELHRVYRIQRNLMEVIKRKESDKIQNLHSPFSPMNGNSAQARLAPSQNGFFSKPKDIDVLESRPMKVQRKMSALELPEPEYANTEEMAILRNEKPESRAKTMLGDVGMDANAPACIGSKLVNKNELRILGFSIFEEPKVSENAFSGDNSSRKVFDINLPCDDDSSPDLNKPVMEDRTEVSILRRCIDLNLCLSEDEEVSQIPFARSSNVTTTETMTEIDLEAPAVFYAEELENEREFAKIAAEAIVGISSFVDESDLDDSFLYWFAEIASSCANEMEINGGDSSEEVDFFEWMTLQLKEMIPEEYFGTQLVSGRLLAEQATEYSLSGACSARPRRGRGRQRKNFQLEILPSLASLSRHEMTEDLQTLVSTMRATGHSWQPGSARRNSMRNGCGRGWRPRQEASISPPPIVAAIPALTRQVTGVEVGLECKTLMGWGKTTRRPPRQRGPPANPKPPLS